MQPDRTPDPSDETIRVATATADPVRPRTPNRSNVLPSRTPLQQASRMDLPVLPTSRGPRTARRTGPINPVYLLLITVVPLAILASMVWAAAGMYHVTAAAPANEVVVLTPAFAAAPDAITRSYKPAAADQTREGDIVFTTGTVTNNTQSVVRGVYLKAFLYRTGANGAQELVRSGVGNALGDIAPGASAPFTVTSQLSGGPVPKDGTPTPAKNFDRVEVFVDQVVGPTSVPASH